MNHLLRSTPPGLLVLVLLSGCLGNTPGIMQSPSPTQTHSPSHTPTPDENIQVETISPTVTPFLLSNQNLHDHTLVFTRMGQGGNGIYMFPTLEEEATLVIGQEYTTLFYESPSLSPDGHTLVFSSNFEGSFYIYTYGLVDGELHRLTGDLGDQHFPAWSPDGRYISFASMSDIYLYDMERLEYLLLARLEFWPISLTWSPTGDRIAFLGGRNDNQTGFELFTMNITDGGLRQITEAVAGYSSISWSPDGRQIAFRTFAGCGDIGILDLETGEISLLRETPNVERDPAWSPDGEYIVYAMATYDRCDQSTYAQLYGGPFDLFITTVDGASSIRLTDVEGAVQPAWWPIIDIQISWQYQISAAGPGSVILYDNPSISGEILETLEAGTIFTVVEGPVMDVDTRWWRVRTAAALEGWMVDVPGSYVLEAALP